MIPTTTPAGVTVTYRANGFYWVRYGGELIIAEYEDGKWWVTGHEMAVSFNEAQIYDKAEPTVI